MNAFFSHLLPTSEPGINTNDRQAAAMISHSPFAAKSNLLAMPDSLKLAGDMTSLAKMAWSP